MRGREGLSTVSQCNGLLQLLVASLIPNMVWWAVVDFLCFPTKIPDSNLTGVYTGDEILRPSSDVFFSPSSSTAADERSA